MPGRKLTEDDPWAVADSPATPVAASAQGDDPWGVAGNQPDPWQATNAATAAAPRNYTLGGFGKNAATSFGNFVTSPLQALVHPIDSAKNLAIGAVGALTPPGSGPPGSWQHDVLAPAGERMRQFYGDRYFSSPGAILKTAYKDPFGLLGDISTAALGGEGLLNTGARVAEAANAPRALSGLLDKAADASGAVSRYTNPVSAVTMPVGAGIRKLAGASGNLNVLDTVGNDAMQYAFSNPRLRPYIDAATATGSPYLLSMKGLAKRMPFSGVPEDELAQLDSLNAELRGLGQRTAPAAQAIDPAGTSMRIDDARQAAAAKYGGMADQAYAKARAAANASPVTVRTGTQQIPAQYSTLAGPDGQPVLLQPARTVPVTKSISGPVDMRPLKAASQKFLDELEEARKANPYAIDEMTSPSLKMLRGIVGGDDFVPLNTGLLNEQALGRLRFEKEIGGYPQKIFSELDPIQTAANDKTAAALGPDVAQALSDGRAFTGMKYDVSDEIPGFLHNSQDAGAITKKVLAGNDAGIKTLAMIQKYTPEVLPDIKRTAVEGLMKGITDSGSVDRVQTSLSRWNDLGDRTKQILFTPGEQEEIRNLLEYSKRVTRNANPSGSAHTGMVAMLTKGLLTDPVSTVGAMVGARRLAKGLFDPDLAEKMWSGQPLVSLPKGPAARVAGGLLNPNTAGTVLRPQQAQPPVGYPWLSLTPY